MNTDLITSLALAAALAWASGIRLYAVLLLVGLAHRFHWFGWQAPESLEVLAHPYVLAATTFLVCAEFFADKIPWFDSLWDAVHTFIRIPGGALLAIGALAPGDSAAWVVVAGLLGGSITAGTHFMKAGGRAAINTSPEPFTNWTASLSEDATVLGGLWLAIAHPLVFLALLIAFLALVAWILPKVWRFSGKSMRRLFGSTAEPR